MRWNDRGSGLGGGAPEMRFFGLIDCGRAGGGQVARGGGEVGLEIVPAGSARCRGGRGKEIAQRKGGKGEVRRERGERRRERKEEREEAIEERKRQASLGFHGGECALASWGAQGGEGGARSQQSLSR